MNDANQDPRRTCSTCGVKAVAAALGLALLGLIAWRSTSAWTTQRSEQVIESPISAVSGTKPGSPVEQRPPGQTFLDAFGTDARGEQESAGPVLDDQALVKRHRALLDIQQRQRELGERVSRWQNEVKKKELEEVEKQQEKLAARFDVEVAAFEKELARARKERPEAAVPAWLTGELLILVHGEPEEILPHLERARAAGLDRAELWASLARTQVEANRFDEAFRDAARALDMAPRDPDVWEVLVRIAFNTQRFEDVMARLDRTWPDSKPAWAAEIRRHAAARLADWQLEQKLRAAEARADDLPRVRLVVEHRRFARDAKGTPLTKVESTGGGEVVVELFEDQAPAAVANFLTLAAQKKYDGTRFYLAEAATFVAGGDIQSRDRDAKEDGRGNPGYFIPDEFQRKDARSHYRGALSLVNSGPGTSGCQFFITLVPMPEMDGRWTVFGRVIHGQDVVDRITRGRTNLEVGPQGRLIPGDLLVRAEVLRKRAHDYRVPKQ